MIKNTNKKDIYIRDLFLLKSKVFSFSIFFFVFYISNILSVQAVTIGTVVGKEDTGLNLGLVGWWTMDGKSISNGAVLDMSGNGKTGNLVSIATSTFYTAGKIGQGFNFDGVDDAINVSSVSSSLGTGNISVSFWFKPNVTNYYSGTTGGYFFSLADSPSTNDFKIATVASDGDIIMSMYTSGGVLKTTSNYTPVETIKAGKWYHVVGVFSTSFGMRLYINNRLTTTNSDLTRGATQATLAYIGKQFNGYPLNVSMDDFRFYNRALSASEIQQLYSMGSETKVTTPVGKPSSGLNSGLVGWWTMDGDDATWTSDTIGTVMDKSTSSNTGTLTNMSRSFSQTLGKIGQALKFDGNDDRINSVLNSGLSNSFTFSAWIYPTANTFLVQGVVTSEVASYGNYWASLANGTYTGSGGASGSMKFCLYDGTNNPCADTISALTLNKWTHVVGVRDVSTDLLLMYKDGVLIESDTDTTTSVPTYSQFNVGGQQTQSNRYFPGYIDDVRVYNRALSASEIQQLYSQGSETKVTTPVGKSGVGLNSSLVGWWTFDGKNMKNNVTDSSGQGNHGYMTNISTSTAQSVGILGQSLNFRKDDSGYISVPDNSLLDNSSTISFGGWFYMNQLPSSGTYYGLACKRTDANTANSYCAFMNESGYLNADIAGFDNRFISSATLSPRKWNHFMVVFDGGLSSGQRSKIYINGQLDITATETASSIGNGASGLGLGFLPGNSVGYMDGKMDDMRVYRKALSASEIQQLYNMGR